MKSLQSIPLFKLLLFFILGIFLARDVGSLIVYAGLVAFALLGISCWLDRHFPFHWYEALQSCLIFLCLFCLGASVRQLHTTLPGLTVAHVNCQQVEVEGVVGKQAKQTPYGQKAFFEATTLWQDGEAFSLHGKLMLYLSPKDTTRLRPYQRLRIQAKLSDLRSRYPSYLRYLHQQGIRHAAYVESVQVLGTQRSASSVFWQVQQAIARRLSAYMPDPALAGIGRAMFVGDKQELSERDREVFARAGASHVLAISGMHVGIIYLLLGWLLRPLHVVRHGKRLKHVLILLMLLLYMGLTGASPAVVRSVLMFGAILLFNICYQRYHILNLLALSAFLQLMYDSSLLYSISFQLSYSAVAGIVILYPYFERMFPTDQPLLQKVYGCVGVSITATLATAPLVWMYFGQFPTYFLLTNLLIALISAGTVFAGFLTVMFIWVPGLAELCAYVAYLLLHGLNAICAWVADLPHALITRLALDEQGVYILGLELCLAALMLSLPRWMPMLQRCGRQLTKSDKLACQT